MPSALDERRASLSPAKQALLEKRLRGERPSSPASLPIVRVGDRRQLPLSHAQQRLWFIHQLDPESTAYNLLFAVRVSGPLNREAVQWSVDEIVRRHEVLRTTFFLLDGVPLQQSAATLHVPVEYLDISDRNHQEAKIEGANLAQGLAAQPFHLTQGPLLRVRLVALAGQEHIFVVSMHHIVSDAWSTAIMMREFSEFYKAHVTGSAAPLTVLPIQYADYAVWQRSWLRGPVLDVQLNYWKKQLQDAPVLDLPTDYLRPAVMSHRGASVEFHIGPAVVSNLLMINQQEKSTLFMDLLAAFAVLLSRYSGQSDLTIGSPIANRNRVELENLIGFFVNMLTFRMDLQGNPTFRQMLRRVQQTAFDAYHYQDVPFEKIVEELQPEREMNRTPLFQVTLTLQNAEQGSIELPDVSLSPFNVPVRTTMYELSLFFNQSGQGLDAALLYCCDLFEPQTMVRFSRHMESILELMSRAPDTPIRGWSLLTEAEQQQVTVERNHLHRYPCDKVLPAWFEEQAERMPNAIAVVCEDRQLSYISLNSRANQLAHRLKKFHVGPEIKVAMCMERSLEMVIAMLGIVKAGGVYVPIDPSYPPERASYMLKDSGAKVLLTHPLAQSTLPESSIPILSLDPDWEAIAEESTSNPERSISPDNAAYVIYTSGSTGQPKGVLVTHSNVVRLFTATRRWFEFTDQDVWTLFHSYAFDFSVWELWGALLYGGRLIVVPYWVSRSPEAFYHLLKENKVTVLNQTPSAFRQLSDVEATKQPEAEELSLRWVIFGGEALEMSSLRPWLARHGEDRPRLINMYGITETTVHVTYQQLGREAIHQAASVVGERIPDLQIYILDDYMQPVPVGVKGELFVGGAGLARGYMNRPDLTAQRFLPSPFSQTAGERLYRSGDQARWRNDGSLEYLGRLDHQVKIRGFRIELEEIEAALLEAGVRHAVVLAQQEDAGEKRLIAYVVLENAIGNQEFMQELRGKLKHRLPGYMVPAAIVPIEKIPLTGNGKIDRKALLAVKPDTVLSLRRFAPPQTPVEETLCRILAEVLGLERVGIEDNFFELGGDSILSIQVMTRARKAGLQFSLAQFFASPHIKELAQSITVVTEDQPAQPAPPFRLLSHEDRKRIPAGVMDAYPLSGLQAGMLFHTEFRGTTSLYHNVLSCHVRAHLDATILQKAVDEIVALHPVLRTSFDLSGYSEPLQLVHRDAGITLAFDNIEHLSIAEQEDILAAWIEAEKQRPFDVSQPGLLRFQVHRRSPDTFQFTMAEHHAILDGWSVAMLLTQIFHLYFSLLEAREQTIEPPASSFHEFVELERQILQSEETRQYWQQQMDDLEVAPVFSKTGKTQGTLSGWQIEIQTALFHQLKKLAVETAVSIKSVLLAAHLAVVSFVSGRKDIITGLVSNGRVETKDGERSLGLFLNTVPLRRKLSSGRWIHLVRETAAAEQALLPHRRYPLSKLQQMAGGIPLFDIMFNFVHFHILREIKSAGLEVLDTRGVAPTNFALATSFAVTPVGSAVDLTLNYDGTLLSQDRIVAIAGYYLTALEAMVDDPQAYYDSTSLLSEGEKQQLLLEWNRTDVKYSQDTIHARFEQQAALTPDNEAVIFDGQSMTYAELDRHTGQLAHHLHNLGVGPETVVAISMNRSMEMVIGLLAVLKAGGAYLPLDPDSPTERLKFMLEDSRAKLVLTHAAGMANLPRHPSFPIVFVENISPHLPMLKTSDVTVEGRHPAYVIYTSGSTGQPKGVVITHSAIANHMNWVQENFQIGSGDRLLQKTVFTFDAAVWEFYAPLLAGGCLVMAKPGGQHDPEYLLRSIQEARISVLQLVPSQLRMLLEHGGLEKCHSLQRIYCGGEALSKELVAQCRFELPSARLYNFYGPTEATIDAAWSECRLEDDPIPIGRPVANTQLYVLNDDMQLLPAGSVGELFIAGAALARGYLNQPGLTAGRFLPNPFSATPGDRMYRTGDLVRYRKDSELEYLGRRDHQVKVRGYRIELGEIESALAQHPSVQGCVVMAREDRPREKRLIAYVKTATQADDLAHELRAHLRKSLPEYMVPSIVLLDRFPLTSSGKVNRKALPVPETAGLESPSLVVPRTELEHVLSAIFNNVLAVRSGIRDNFFDLGGHSLDAIRTLALIEKTTGNRISLADLFHNPTVEQLAVFLQGRLPAQKWSCLVPLRKQGSRKPLYFVHPVGGSVICYQQITECLGPDQPVYAFQSRGLNPDLQPHSEITEMAAAYVYELLQADAQGPYLLGGWSMGGVVAFEMARQLRERNLPVALLCLIDSYPQPPGSRSGFEGREQLLWAFAGDLGLSASDLPVIQRNSARENFDGEFSSVIEIAKTKHLVSSEIELSQAERLFRIFTQNLQAAQAYRPLPCEIDLVLFQAENRPASHDNPAEAWRLLVTGNIESHIIPGNHYSILENSSALAILTKYLEACLERANSNFESAPAR